MDLKVVRGNPTPEELAAAVAVVTARSAAVPGGEDEAAPTRRWSDPARVAAGGMPRFGAGAWRTTYWPR